MPDLSDHGLKPYVLDIEDTTLQNPNFRSTIWTGKHLQLTVMCIPVGGDIGLEIHPDNDQFLRIEQGECRVEMGPEKSKVTFRENATASSGIFVPCGTWHNIINTGKTELKVYTLYGPSHHPAGTIHKTQHDAEIDPREH